MKHLLDLFHNLAPRHKQWVVLSAVGLVLLGLILVFASSQPKKRVQNVKEQKYDYSVLAVPKADVSQVGYESLQGQVTTQNAEIENLKKQLNELAVVYGAKNNIPITIDKPTGLKVPLPGINDNGLMTDGLQYPEVKTPVDKIFDSQQKDIDGLKDRDVASGKTLRYGKSIVRGNDVNHKSPGGRLSETSRKDIQDDGENSQAQPVPPEPVKPTLQIRMLMTKLSNTASGVVSTSLNPGDPSPIKRVSDNPADGHESLFLPAGSIISGVLITGMDAPTSPQARKEPFPALVRIKHEAILPNDNLLGLNDCFLIAGGMGDLSSERIMLRAESLSCSTEDGGVVEVSLDAYATGDDGKAGIRGRVVTRNGQMIAQTLLAGFMQGISSAYTPQAVPALNVSGSGSVQYQTPSTSYVMQSGAMNGAHSAAGRLADYWMDLAKEITPVIELDAGRQVDFIVKKGVVLKAGLEQVSRSASVSNITRHLPSISRNNQ